jgi:hypothetical protein
MLMWDAPQRVIDATLGLSGSDDPTADLLID